jgi:photosystem II stability/assembly factor-like uncharacterized protein
MKSTLFLRLMAAFLLPTIACSLVTGGDNLPPTATPEPEAEPSATPRGDAVDEDGFFVLNLTDSDQEGLELRVEEIFEGIINNGSDVDRGVLLEAYAQLAELPRVGGDWRSVGPAPIEGVYMPQGRIPSGGRVNAFVIDPRNSNVVYAAASIGGLWKTEDGGQTWRSLTDGQVPLLYGGLEMDPQNPDTLYALLGEFDGQVSYSYGFLANGIMRSRDAGETWELIGAETFNAASVTGLVFAEDGTLYASSGQKSVAQAPPDQPEFGIFQSSDGGDTWDRLLSCSDFADCVPNPASGATSYLGGFFDLDLASDGTLYTTLCFVQCSGTLILRSFDGGASWEELDFSNVLEDWSAENGVNVTYVDDAGTIPHIEAIELDVAPSDPNVLLAGGGINWWSDDGNEGFWSFVMRSFDGGDSWEWLANAGDYCTAAGSSPQCDYDNVIEIDPNDANVMYVGGSFSIEPETYNWIWVLMRSPDGGDSWYDMSPAVDGSLLHPDIHGIAIDPNDPEVIWAGTDGGVARTTNASGDPTQWEHLGQGMNTLLFIDVALHPTDPDFLVGGLQDNAKAFTTDQANWEGASSGDGAFVAVDPFDPSIVYGTIYPPSIFERNHEGGAGDYTTWSPDAFTPGYVEGLDQDENWLFYPPFAVDPTNEGVIYLPSNRLYATEDRGDSWFPISPYLNDSDFGSIQSIALAPSDTDVIYLGTTDGALFVSRDGLNSGEDSWENITDTSFPPRNLASISVDPEDPDRVYAIFGGFDVQTPDTPGHVFLSTDGGGSWEDITHNLPDAPLATSVVDVRADYAGLYVGGVLGVWVLQDGSDEWLPYGNGMPFSIVTGLELNPDTGVMAASTYGRSVWVIDMP